MQLVSKMYFCALRSIEESIDDPAPESQRVQKLITNLAENYFPYLM